MIQFTNVFKSYENGTDALRGISFGVEEGEFVFLVGPSGSGKSTIMKLITGEIRPSQGAVMVNNFDIGKIKHRHLPKLRRTLGTIFQDFRLIDKKTVYDNIALAARVIGKSNKEISRQVPEKLALVGLSGYEHMYPGELSGGEQQRVSIARALVNNPKIIIADEPTGNIDPVRSLEIMTLLEQINQEGTTVLVVTHEKSLVDRMRKRVVAIDDGIIIRDSIGEYMPPEPDPEPEPAVETPLPRSDELPAVTGQEPAADIPSEPETTDDPIEDALNSDEPIRPIEPNIDAVKEFVQAMLDSMLTDTADISTLAGTADQSGVVFPPVEETAPESLAAAEPAEITDPPRDYDAEPRERTDSEVPAESIEPGTNAEIAAEAPTRDLDSALKPEDTEPTAKEDIDDGQIGE
jgi:cell division transport system ATP-binding protein